MLKLSEVNLRLRIGDGSEIYILYQKPPQKSSDSAVAALLAANRF